MTWLGPEGKISDIIAMKKCPGERLCEFVAAKFYVTWSLKLFGSGGGTVSCHLGVDPEDLRGTSVPKFGEPMVLASQRFLHAEANQMQQLNCALEEVGHCLAQFHYRLLMEKD